MNEVEALMAIARRLEWIQNCLFIIQIILLFISGIILAKTFK